jgi:16S rRNA (guanine527-N7)-methyltransferase
MGVELPGLTADHFADEIRQRSPEPLTEAAIAALFAHYEELRRWSPRLALIGPGTAGEILDRHFAESLAAIPYLPPVSPAAGALVDVGSGAGFPGLVLAAARPSWRITLVEPRGKKWSFLQAAARRAALSVRCLDARVAAPLPEGVPAVFDAVTVRALRLDPSSVEALAARLTPAGRFLFWAGAEDPLLAAGWRWIAAQPLGDARQRRLLVAARATQPSIP